MAIGVRESFACFGGRKRCCSTTPGLSPNTTPSVGTAPLAWRLQGARRRYGFAPRSAGPIAPRLRVRSSSSVQWLSDEGFVIPLAATLKSAGLMLDVHTACTRPTPILRAARGGRARARHGTTAKRRAHRLGEERNALLALPVATASTPRPITPKRQVMPRESLQHPQRL